MGLAIDDGEGLYLTEQDVGLKVKVPHEPEQDAAATVYYESQIYVTAETFMKVQKERDDQRKTLGFINAVVRRFTIPLPWLDGLTPRQSLLKLLDMAGLDDGDAKAMAGILQWARDEREKQG